MDEIEFLPSVDVAAEPVAPVGPRPRWRLVQPAMLAALGATAAALVLVHAGEHGPARHGTDLPPLKPVHIGTYTPWHERAILGGGGAYIF